ncbi:MAG: YicC/YloC family endoribonuclease [Chlamydiota bacterium]
MTGYGRAEVSASAARFVVEIRSVNKKHLDTQVILPKELTCFEVEVKKRFIAAMGRGSVNCFITASYERQSPVTVQLNLPLVRQLKKCWEELADELGEKFTPQLAADILRKDNMLLSFQTDISDSEVYRQPLLDAVDQALKNVNAMKEQEGLMLYRDIESRLNILEELIVKIENDSSDATEKYRQKLHSRLQELFEGVNTDLEERVLREVAIYAERVDIAEEITRFKGALTHFREQVENATGSVGKTLDFIVQELNREINTIGSKSSNSRISHKVVEAKAELERIREQLQNVE